MRLIDADKLLEVLNKKSVPFNANVNDAILTAPTVDAVDRELYEQCKFDKDIAEEQLKKIVRCKDCKFGQEVAQAWVKDVGAGRRCKIFEISMSPNGFCSFGERKENVD